MAYRPLAPLALLGLGLSPLVGCASPASSSVPAVTSARPTPTPTAQVRILVYAIDDPILHHTAIRLRPHNPADVLVVGIGTDQQTPAATAAIAAWARGSGLTVTAVAADHYDVSVAASTARIEKALRVTINDYRLPGGYTFWANDRPPTVPAALPIRFILGLSDYQRAMLPGPLVAPTPTPRP